MNTNKTRVKNVYKTRGLLYTIKFIFMCYVVHATKDNNILNAWR